MKDCVSVGVLDCNVLVLEAGQKRQFHVVDGEKNTMIVAENDHLLKQRQSFEVPAPAHRTAGYRRTRRPCEAQELKG
jgi:hypothetical protein